MCPVDEPLGITFYSRDLSPASLQKNYRSWWCEIFIGQMPFLSPSQQSRSINGTEGRAVISDSVSARCLVVVLWLPIPFRIVFCLLVVLVRLSVPVQVIDWKWSVVFVSSFWSLLFLLRSWNYCAGTSDQFLNWAGTCRNTVHWLERLVSEMTYNVLMGTLNSFTVLPPLPIWSSNFSTLLSPLPLECIFTRLSSAHTRRNLCRGAVFRRLRCYVVYA